MSVDDEIAQELHNYGVIARQLGFTRVPNRSDGMLSFDGWSFETQFVHGEGRIIMTKDRYAGARSHTDRYDLPIRKGGATAEHIRRKLGAVMAGNYEEAIHG